MVRDEVLPVLMRDPWFASLPGELVALILKHSFERDYPAGRVVFNTGDVPNGQFAVLNGEVRLVSHSRNGRDVLFDRFRQGSWFGHLSVLDGLPRFQDAVACCPTRLLQLPLTGFQEIVAKRPEFALDFSRLICVSIRIAMQAIIDARTSSISTRLAQLLINLDGLPASSVMGGHEPRITQEALAAMTGTSRQTVSRLLTRWERGGLVALSYGSVTLLQPQRIAAMAGLYTSTGECGLARERPDRTDRTTVGRSHQERSS